jgi:two-component system, response regulator, stage 0 sporulation protein F
MEDLKPRPQVALVADSDAVVRVLLRNALKQRGCQVIEALDGKQTEEVFSANEDKLSCIFLDIKMPDQEGIATLKKIRSLNSSIPIFILSALSDKRTLKKCMVHKVDGFFAKPFDFSRVAAVLCEKYPELLNAGTRGSRSEKRNPHPLQGSIIPMEQKLLNHQIRQEMESVRVLNRKLLPFLPQLTSGRLQKYSAEQRVISKSQTYRVMRFALNASNRDTVTGCIQNLPSQHKIAGALNFMEPRVFIPIIGEILSGNFVDHCANTLQDCVKTALLDLKTISNSDNASFEPRLHITKEQKKAVFLHPPYVVEILIGASSYSEDGFEFHVEKVDLPV